MEAHDPYCVKVVFTTKILRYLKSHSVRSALLLLVFMSLLSCDNSPPESFAHLLQQEHTTANQLSEFANDTLSFSASGDISTLADGRMHEVPAWAFDISEDEYDLDSYAFKIIENSRPDLFAVQPTLSAESGNFKFQPYRGVSGTADLTVVLKRKVVSAGQVEQSAGFRFKLHILSENINQKPVFEVGPDVSVQSTAGEVEFPQWIKQASPGDNTEQRLTFEIISNSRPDLFNSQPWVSFPSLTLRFAPKAGSTGTAQIHLRVKDNGGTEEGGIDTSETQSFLIHVINPTAYVNSAPSFTIGPDVTVDGSDGSVVLPGWAADAHDGDNNTQKLKFVIINNTRPDLFIEQPWISYPSHTLRFKPKNCVVGSAKLDLYLEDNGGTGQGGQNRSDRQSFYIHIQCPQPNKAPQFKVGPDITVPASIGDAAFPAWATAVSDGDRETQTLWFEIVSNDRAELFSHLPRVSYPSRTLRFTPYPDAQGTATLTIRLKDDGGTDNAGVDTSAVQTFHITLTQPDQPLANHVPVVADILVQTAFETVVQFVLQGSDEDGNPLQYTVVEQPDNGTVVIDQDSAIYTPNAGFSGSDVFFYTANDGIKTADRAKVTVTVAAKENKVPVAESLSYTTKQATSVGIVLQGLDQDNDALTYTLINQPAVGFLSGIAPHLEFTPPADYKGEVSFSYRVNDGKVDSASATVTVTVLAVNQSPIAESFLIVVAEDSSVVDKLRVMDHDLDPLSYTIIDMPVHGVVSGNYPDFSYTPDTDYHGSDRFSFKANDGSLDSNIATVDITVNPSNDSPLALPQTVSTSEDTALGIVLTGTDKDKDALDYQVLSQPQNGLLTGVPPQLIYTPNNDFAGVDQFSFKVNDGSVNSAKAIVTIVVSDENDQPTANSQSLLTEEDAVLLLTLTGTDPDADSLGIMLLTQPLHGKITGKVPNLKYTPDADFVGNDQFTFKVNDGNIDSLPASVNITVTAVNDAPIALSSTLSSAEDTSLTIVLDAIDIDADPLTWNVLTQPQYGTLLGRAPNLRYSPDSNFNGSDVFTFNVNDGLVDSNTATINLIINNSNDGPTATGQSLSMDESTSLPITLDGNDPEGDTLSFTITSQPQHGVLSGSAPNFNYNPDTLFTGTDSFQFRVNDGEIDSAIISIVITVNPVNEAPSANSQSIETLEDKTITFTLTGSDPDGDMLSYLITRAPQHGTITGGPIVWQYTPAVNYNGRDSIRFVSSDGLLVSDNAEVTLQITPLNDPPAADSASYRMTDGDTLIITLTANDLDVDPLDFTLQSNPQHGTISGVAPNLIYAPEPGYTGIDGFSFKANDGISDSNLALIEFTITAKPNKPPVAIAGDSPVFPINVSVQLDGSRSFDPDGDDLSYRWSIIEAPDQAEVSLSDATNPSPELLTDTPGFHTLELIVNDGELNSPSSRVVIDVLEANLPPVADAGFDTQSILNSAVLLDGRHSTDPEFDDLTYSWRIKNSPAGSNAGLFDTLSARPYLIADLVGNYSVELMVTDYFGLTDFDSVLVSVTDPGATLNHTPVAAASYTISFDQREDVAIFLDGSASSDADGDSLSFQWTPLDIQPGYPTFNDPTLESPIWTTGLPEWVINSWNHKVQLVVSDGKTESDPVILEIPNNVSQTPLVFFNGAPENRTVSETVSLVVIATDEETPVLDYAWTLIEKPAASTATLSTAATDSTQFFLDAPGIYKVQIVVDDNTPAGRVTRYKTIYARTATNGAPVAIAGADQTVLTTERIILDGRASYDPEAEPLSFFWLIDRPYGSTARFNDPTLAQPTFTVDVAGDYRISLFVSDGQGQSPASQLLITADHGGNNIVPVANAGEDSQGITDSEIELDGSNSYDDNHDPLEYYWQLIAKPTGSNASLDYEASKAEQPEFEPDVAGDYIFQLNVHDFAAVSAPDTVTVSVSQANRRPIANTGQVAGEQKTIVIGESVLLDGAQSYDPEGEAISYSWLLIEKPSGSLAEPENPTSSSSLIKPDLQGYYRLTLKVNDGQVDSLTVSFIIRAYRADNKAPIAVVGTDLTGFINTEIILDGSQAYDPDDDEILGRLWQVVVGPSGANVQLITPVDESPTFIADKPGTYIIGYIVSDGQLTSDTASLRVDLIGPIPPVAVAGNDQIRGVNTTTLLDGRNSYDPDGDKLIFRWSVIAQPVGSQIQLENANKSQAGFSADNPGQYQIQLTVSDGNSEQQDTLLVTLIPNEAPIAHAGSNQSVLTGEFVDLDGTASTDPEGDPLSYSWSIASQPAGSQAIIYSATFDEAFFVPDVAGDYVLQLIVNDSELDSQPVFVTITATRNNNPPIANPGPDRTLTTAAMTTFDASQSSDRDGDALSYRWQIIQAPADSQAQLIAPTSVQADFTPDQDGEYIIELIVNDGTVDSLPVVFRLTAVSDNTIPEAYASYSHAVITGDTVKISGWASNDEDGDILTYQWQMLSKPSGSGTSFSDNQIMDPKIVVDKAGGYELQLIVSDGIIQSEPHSITITAVTGFPGLPPDPGEAGKVTLQGTDSDVDGVRDDIQRHIFATYPGVGQANIRKALTEIAKHYQTILWEALNADRAYNNAVILGRHLECLAYVVGSGSHKLSANLQAEMLNTVYRSDVYQLYDKTLEGSLFHSTRFDEWKDSCAFDVE